MIVFSKQNYLKILEAIFRIYLPFVLLNVFYKVVKRIPFGPTIYDIVITTIVIAISVFIVVAYCSHNFRQGYQLLTVGSYKKLKVISWVALFIGLIYLIDRVRTVLGEFETEGIGSYTIYLILFSIFLANNFYKDLRIVLGKY